MAYDPNNSGSLGKNLKKEGNQPDYKGKIVINGVKYWLSGWVKEHEGRKFISLAPQIAEPVSEQE